MAFIVFYQELDYYTTPEIGGVYENFEKARERVSALNPILSVKFRDMIGRRKYKIWISKYEHGDVTFNSSTDYGYLGENCQVHFERYID